MRISDWSSDVCSSDLILSLLRALQGTQDTFDPCCGVVLRLGVAGVVGLRSVAAGADDRRGGVSDGDTVPMAAVDGYGHFSRVQTTPAGPCAAGRGYTHHALFRGCRNVVCGEDHKPSGGVARPAVSSHKAG